MNLDTHASKVNDQSPSYGINTEDNSDNSYSLGSDDDEMSTEYSDNSENLETNLENDNNQLKGFIDYDNNDWDYLQSEEYNEIMRKIRQPKLHLNPYPSINPNPQNPTILPNNLTNVERVRYIIERKLGPGWTLETYAKFLKEQEDETVGRYNFRKRRKLNNNKK